MSWFIPLLLAANPYLAVEYFIPVYKLSTELEIQVLLMIYYNARVQKYHRRPC